VNAFSDIVPILPPDWPNAKLAKRPGDLRVSEILPHGIGMQGPTVIQPWNSIEGFAKRPNWYSFDPPANDPIEWAPKSLSSGGVIYFDQQVDLANLDAALLTMDVKMNSVDFGVFAAVAQNVLKERFLRQIRIVSSFALSALFELPDAVINAHCKQSITVGRLVRRFVEFERNYWINQSNALYGTLGGDGDLAKEWLSFGFLVENSYYNVYRLWSRPWLATK
jgi:hypothetical protein